MMVYGGLTDPIFIPSCVYVLKQSTNHNQSDCQSVVSCLVEEFIYEARHDSAVVDYNIESQEGRELEHGRRKFSVTGFTLSRILSP